MNRDVRALLDGALAGCIATAAMSAAMLAAQKAGLMGRQPPELIIEKALDAVDAERSEGTQDALSAALHFGFGVTVGALFGLAYRRSELPIDAGVQGIAVGSAVWAVSYEGWVPSLGIMPPVERDRPGRPQSMLAAHWIYGWVLGKIVSARSEKSGEE